MYTMNGFVYGGTPQEALKIEAVKPLNDMILLLTFSSGETRIFDASILNGDVYQKLKNEDVFRNIIIDHGVITWDNGNIDCAPEYMYDNSYEYVIDEMLAL